MPFRAPVEPYAKTRSAGTASFPLEVGVAPQALGRPFRCAGDRPASRPVDTLPIPETLRAGTRLVFAERQSARIIHEPWACLERQ